MKEGGIQTGAMGQKKTDNVIVSMSLFQKSEIEKIET